MAEVKLRHAGGPFGDETSNYWVETDAETIGEFIEEAIKKDNYVTFVICGKTFAERVCVAYALKGVVTRKAKEYDTYVALKPTDINANGGWGAMSYDIEVKDFNAIPQQPQEEFEMVYWGHTFDKKK